MITLEFPAQEAKMLRSCTLGFCSILGALGPGCASERIQPAKQAPQVDMVSQQIESRGVTDTAVLAAMRTVPRHEFVPTDMRQFAYDDRPLPIGNNQTISQPYIVAAMTELAGLDKSARVLEIGTGSGYQTAVLKEVAGEVFSIEIVEPLAQRARITLERLGYTNGLQLRIGDGYAGWAEAAPFDAILVTAAPPKIPRPLLEQLKLGGRLIIPVGETNQELLVITKTADGFARRSVFPVRFVPMTGQAQRNEQ